MNEAAKLAEKVAGALTGTQWAGLPVSASITASVGGPENKGSFAVRIAIEGAFEVHGKNPQAAFSAFSAKLKG